MKTFEINSDATAGNLKPAASDGTNGNARLLFDVRTAAARLSVSVVSIRKLVRQNRLKRIPAFRKILISDGELRRFAGERT